MARTGQHYVLETSASNDAARRIYLEIVAALDRGLSKLGISAVPEDSTGVLAIRVAGERQLGTAYLELGDCDMRMHIVLFDEVTDDQYSERLHLTASGANHIELDEPADRTQRARLS